MAGDVAREFLDLKVGPEHPEHGVCTSSVCNRAIRFSVSSTSNKISARLATSAFIVISLVMPRAPDASSQPIRGS